MATKHNKRPQEGYRFEDRVASLFKRRGFKVEKKGRNNAGHDLVVNGHKVDVKSAVRTSYKGSDGYPIRGFVFTNLKKGADCDFYAMACLDDDRKGIKRLYIIPSSDLQQRTLTLTAAAEKKYAEYKNDMSGLKKQANVYRRGDPNPLGYRDSRILRDNDKTWRDAVYPVLGGLAGGATASTIVPAKTENGYSYREGRLMPTIGGTILGMQVGKHMAKKHNRKK